MYPTPRASPEDTAAAPERSSSASRVASGRSAASMRTPNQVAPARVNAAPTGSICAERRIQTGISASEPAAPNAEADLACPR